MPPTASPTATSAARRAAGSRTTPPLPTRSRGDLELGLDEREHVVGRGEAAEHGGQHLGEGDERDVHHREVGHDRKHCRLQRARVGALQHAHPRIAAQAVVELSITNVHRDHRGGAALQQAVGEAPRRRPHIERNTPRHRDLGARQRVLQLDPPARHIPRALGDAYLHIGRDHLPRLLRAPAACADAHLPRHHRGRGAAARVKQPALGQKGVQTLLAHVRTVSAPPPRQAVWAPVSGLNETTRLGSGPFRGRRDAAVLRV